MDFVALMEISLDSKLKLGEEELPSSCRSCCATYEKIFDMAGMGSMSNTGDQMLVYRSFKPRKNCIARSSSFLCAIMAKAEQEHLMLQVQAGSGLKFSISSQITRNLVKYSVTERAPCFNVDASCCKSEILRRSPCEYLDFRSLQISSALSIRSTLCLIEAATECTIQDTTILLHCR